MRRVLVTHVDSSVGRRLVKVLYHDIEVDLVLGTGTGPTPSFLEPYRDKCAYERIDLARARHLSSFFHSERFATAGIDSVIHLSFCAESAGEHIPRERAEPGLRNAPARGRVPRASGHRALHLPVLRLRLSTGAGELERHERKPAARLRGGARSGGPCLDRCGSHLSGGAEQPAAQNDHSARGDDRDRCWRVRALPAAGAGPRVPRLRSPSLAGGGSGSGASSRAGVALRSARHLQHRGTRCLPPL